MEFFLTESKNLIEFSINRDKFKGSVTYDLVVEWSDVGLLRERMEVQI